MKGKRILVLLDTSASMMDEDVVKIIQLRNQPEAARRAAPKWRRALDMVEWITAQLPDNSQFQVYRLQHEGEGGAARARRASGSPDNDPRAINNVLTATRAITPADGTSLVNALLSARTHQPGARPDHPHHRRPAHAGLGAAVAQVHQRAASAKNSSTTR